MTSGIFDMTREVKLNDDQKLYVIPAGESGYSCFGYENAFRDATAIAEKLNLEKPDRADIGTIEMYDRYRELVALLGKDNAASSQTWYTPGTPTAVIRVLDEARRTDRRLIISLGDSETGRAWGDVSRGRIGRSTGTMKVPLLIPRSDSSGGEAILVDCIVRIQDSKSKQDLYRHPTFNTDPKPEAQAAADIEEEASGPAFR
jgi:hypothetical protein